MKDGVLRRGGTRPVIVFERDLPGTPDAVWKAITDPDELASWFPCGVVIDEWKVGATIVFTFPGHDDMQWTGAVPEIEEPRRLAYTWGDETLRFELTASTSGRTRLVMSDELDDPAAARNAAGWEICLERLENRVPADGAWQTLFDHYTSSFEPALGPQEGPPAGFEEH